MVAVYSAFQNPSIWNQYEEFKKFSNFVTGSFTGATNWNWQMFDQLFRCSWLAEKLCTVIPEDMTDKWRVFKHDNPKIVEMRTKFEHENEIAAKVREALVQARLYGGSTIFPIIRGSLDKLNTLFDLNEVKKDSLIGFHVLTKFDFMPFGGINRDILVEPRFFGDYIFYKLIRIQTAYSMGAAIDYGFTGQEPVNQSDENIPIIHVSRMIKFIGKDLPYYQKFFSGGWGDSILTPLLDKIPAIDEAFALMYLYFDEFNIDEYKVQGLSSIVNNSSGDELFLKYKKLRERMRDTKVRFVDANDDLNRNQLQSIGNIPHVFDSMINYIVAATGIPITRLLGTSIKGFGTGENELIQYYDLINQQQTRIKYQLRYIDEIIERHLFGKKMNIDYEFKSKRELTEEQKAEIQSKQAAMYSAYVTARVMTPKIVAENIKENFVGIDDAYIATLEEDFLSYQEDMAALTSEYEEEDQAGGEEKKESQKEKDNSTAKDDGKKTTLNNSEMVDRMGEESNGILFNSISKSEKHATVGENNISIIENANAEERTIEVETLKHN